jgi:hypothetical protein
LSDFSLVQGVSVPDLTGIHECYDIRHTDKFFKFTINISATNIAHLIKDFCSDLAEPCFFIFEVPTSEADENLIRLKATDPFHGDIYYCDGLSRQVLFEIMEKYGELLINDGMVRFGFASHAPRGEVFDELFIGKYKIVTIFTGDEQRYKMLMSKLGINFEEKIKTVWDNFSHETPGKASRISVDGKDIYDVLKELKEYGLYFAKRQEQ